MESSPIRYSKKLAALGWLEHAFLPAGTPPPDPCAFAHQRHSAVAVEAERAIPPKSVEADAVISRGELAVAVYTADCLPVLIADHRHRQVAAIHAGLQGALAGVLFSAVERLISQGARPDDLWVAIGPAISPCCYELGEDRLAVVQANPRVQQPVRWHRDRPLNPLAVRPQAVQQQQGIWFDLPQLGKQMLEQQGIPAAQIDLLNVCTYCMAEPHSSYRYNSHHGTGYASRYAWIRRKS